MPAHIEAAVATAAETSVEPDYRDPVHRMSQLLDPGSLEPVHRREGLGVVVARGRVDGSEVVAYATDGSRLGGVIGATECRLVAAAIDSAVARRCPVVGIWHTAGATPAEGVAALDGVGQVYAAMVRASGTVPQISLVLGPAAGGTAFGPALTDVVIMSAAGRMYVAGPDDVRSVTGAAVDPATLGGPEVHARSGAAHVVTEFEADAYRRARELVALFTRPGHYDLESLRTFRDPSVLLPALADHGYDVRPLVAELLDTGSFVELQARWAPNVVTGLGRLGRRTVGVVANNPGHAGGRLDASAAEKSARFVRMCDALGVPLVTVVDVPGHQPGPDQEAAGAVRREATLLHAYAEAVVPRITLVTRQANGSAAVAMSSRSLGAHAVVAWPDAAPATEDYGEAIRLGVVDEVVDPVETRRRLGELLAAAPAGRGKHTNIPL
ncbi:MAG TPA: carboxyl transferase domain-containing protein [Actinophytocola sp.]|jgi:acetyl-CoA/propionyl-CoA carboxylase carboxyl transferase subunit|nr:carboxyl transferase domain-containing protein [Actinophytocola sp.]